MTRRPVDPVVALILDNADAAERGVRSVQVPRRDIPDLVQSAIVIALERHARGGFTLPDDPDRAAYLVGAFLYTAARYLALEHRRKVARCALPGVLPEQAVDPIACLEARSELYRLAADSGIHKFLASDVTLEEYLYDPGVSEKTAGSRRYRLRHGATKR